MLSSPATRFARAILAPIYVSAEDLRQYASAHNTFRTCKYEYCDRCSPLIILPRRLPIPARWCSWHIHYLLAIKRITWLTRGALMAER